jgi:hypothetical protein
VSRLIVVIREPLRSMLTAAGLKVAQDKLRNLSNGNMPYFVMQEAVEVLGLDIAFCCESPDECADCRQRRIDAAEAAHDDRRAGL